VKIMEGCVELKKEEVNKRWCGFEKNLEKSS
jgi:hypothetical protein